jgi:hypothetical protein
MSFFRHLLLSSHCRNCQFCSPRIKSPRTENGLRELKPIAPLDLFRSAPNHAQAMATLHAKVAPETGQVVSGRSLSRPPFLRLHPFAVEGDNPPFTINIAQRIDGKAASVVLRIPTSPQHNIRDCCAIIRGHGVALRCSKVSRVLNPVGRATMVSSSCIIAGNTVFVGPDGKHLRLPPTSSRHGFELAKSVAAAFPIWAPALVEGEGPEFNEAGHFAVLLDSSLHPFR